MIIDFESKTFTAPSDNHYILVCDKSLFNYFHDAIIIGDHCHIRYYTTYIKDDLMHLYNNKISFIVYDGDDTYTYDGVHFYDEYVSTDLTPSKTTFVSYVDSRKYTIDEMYKLMGKCPSYITLSLSNKFSFIKDTVESNILDGIIDIKLYDNSIFKELLSLDVPHMIMFGFYENIYIGMNGYYHEYNNLNLINDVTKEVVDNYKLLSMI